VEEFYLILGCFGQKDDGFISCPSCENRILDLTKQLDKYNEMMDYFDTCRLFDRPMFEYSSIAHFIKNMQDRFDQITIGKRLWPEKRYHLYQKFMSNHRICGLYIKLVLIDNTEKLNKIEQVNHSKIIKPKINIKLINNVRKNQ
jgi:hypothetical protein